MSVLTVVGALECSGEHLVVLTLHLHTLSLKAVCSCLWIAVELAGRLSRLHERECGLRGSAFSFSYEGLFYLGNCAVYKQWYCARSTP